MMAIKTEDPNDIRFAVRERYGNIAEKRRPEAQSELPTPAQSSCCGTKGESQPGTIAQLYEDPNAFELPSDVTDLSLGCGDPVTLASLEAGQTVLDLGSGGGIDCFLAAKKVGPAGRVIGVDMTPAMLERARANKAKLGAENVEFRLGEIENLPVADETVDVIISNCVINLSPDKPQVFREAFRALRPGGRLAVSDIVTEGPLPEVIKNSLSAWAGCIAGAMDVNEYIAAIQDAGFSDVNMTPSYWEQGMIDTAIEGLDPDLKAQVKEAKAKGKVMMIVNEDGEGEMIEIPDGEEFKAFDPQKAIFSAKITARKPV
jgi:arsenite methyltransferase